MIFTIVAFIYITIVSWTWGILLFKLLQVITKEHEIIQTGPVVTCFCGLAFTGIALNVLSLVLPLGQLTTQAFILLPAILLLATCRSARSILMQQYRELFRASHPVAVTLTLICVAVVLIMSTSIINHPDTLHYHAQCIQWIEKFKVVPGLVNLTYHYGLQSSWFTLSAFYSFRFTGTNALTYVNSSIIIWFVIFTCLQINRFFSKKQGSASGRLTGFMWLLLLVTAWWSYTQVRLTITSASPDFIAAMYVWLVFFLLVIRTGYTRSYLLLLVLLGCFAATIKLSTLPVVLFSFIVYYRFDSAKRNTLLLLPLAAAFFVMAPFVWRNIITTGYPAFPSRWPDIVNADWKAPENVVRSKSEYIKFYARTADSTSSDYNMNASGWLPIWWNNRSIADKAILVSFVALLVANVIFFNRSSGQKSTSHAYGLAGSLLGMLFWFIIAPDPRFGFGFIIPAIGFLLYFIHPTRFAVDRKWLVYSSLVFCLLMFSYLVYRTRYYLNAANILKPAGLVKMSFRAINCSGVNIRIPAPGNECGDAPLPCAYNSDCSTFLLRGTRITDGFRPGTSVK